MGRTSSTYGAIQKRIQSFSGETWANRPLGRPKRRSACSFDISDGAYCLQNLGNISGSNVTKWFLHLWYQVKITGINYTSLYHVTAWLFNQHPSGLHHLRSVYQQVAPSFLETGKSPTVPDPNCMEDARRCLNGIAHASRLVFAGQYTDMHCHARTIPRKSLPLRKDNLRSHWPGENE